MNPVNQRLKEELDNWRRDTPQGFSGKLTKNQDGSLNLYKWECTIPGPRNTVWENGNYKFQIIFDEKQLNWRPQVQFTPPIFHPNVDQSGFICSTLLGFWPKFSVKQLIFGVQSFLESPNPHSSLNSRARKLFLEDRERYNKCVRDAIDIL